MISARMFKIIRFLNQKKESSYTMMYFFAEIISYYYGLHLEKK